MDYIIARKVLKKFESMNVSFVRDEITGLINYIEKTFGKAEMPDSKAYLRRIQNKKKVLLLVFRTLLNCLKCIIYEDCYR